MTTADPGQPQLLLLLLLLYYAVAYRVAKAARSRKKISVPVGYKFSPTDGDLVDHHLKRKLINFPEQHCLIPEHNHYEAEPWDLITKYNELSDGESNIDECFFFSTNSSNSSSKRVNRRTPKGHWHETSEKKTIQGSDGVAYVMRYFTFYNGHRLKRDITPWRMREFTHPYNKELALCKIFKDVDGQKKKNNGQKDGRASVTPEPGTSIPISSGYQTPEPYADMAREVRTPTSANLANNNSVSPQWLPIQFDETLLSDANTMNYGLLSPHEQNAREVRTPSSANLADNNSVSPQWQPTQFDETALSDANTMNYGELSPHEQNAFADQFLDFKNPRQDDHISDPNLMKDGVIAPHQQQPTHTRERSQSASQSVSAGQFLDFSYPRLHVQLSDPNLMKDGVISPHQQSLTNTKEGSPLAQSIPNDEYNKDGLYSHNVTRNTSDVPYCKRPRMAEGEGTSLEASQQPRMKKSRISVNDSQNFELAASNFGYSLQQAEMDWERNFSSMNNSLFNSSMFSPQGNNMLTSYGSEEVNSEEIQTSRSNGISLDDIPNTNGTNIEGHSNEYTVSLSPSNYSTYEPTGNENHVAQQPVQQPALPGHFTLPQSPTQPCNPCSNTTPQQMDKPTLPKEWYSDTFHQYLWEFTKSYSPPFI